MRIEATSCEGFLLACDANVGQAGSATTEGGIIEELARDLVGVAQGESDDYWSRYPGW